MKNNAKGSENFSTAGSLPKSMPYFFFLLSLIFIFYSVAFVYDPYPCTKQFFTAHHQSDGLVIIPSGPTPKSPDKTDLSHVVFGIAASAKHFSKRKSYIKQWWRPNETRGIVWLDEHVEAEFPDEQPLPPLKISGDTWKFKYKNPKGHRSAIRISRIISETLRLGMEDVRWFVMGDDDTVFFPDNLVRVLQKYDHNQYYYIGSSSESHLQNVQYFSYNMAYGGGGFAISYPLAKALEKIQDRCIQRYPGLFGSDDRIQACMAELGVPLTKEQGFHQHDVHGNVFGLLAAHPIAPLVSLHHLDFVEPIFPNMNRVQALEQLKVPLELDSAALMQQSICYDKARSWTVSVSWGYAVQIFRGVISAREMELPARTFYNWHPKVDFTGYEFNTRPVSRHPCQKPFVYFISSATHDSQTDRTTTEYLPHQISRPECRWRMADPSQIDRVEVYKKPNPFLWDKPPRRNCCRILPTANNGTMAIDVGECKEDEIIELQ